MGEATGLLLDYTRSMGREKAQVFLRHFAARDDTSLIILYGNRAYPLCELNCRGLAGYESIPPLEGPPEPYRAVVEAVEAVKAHGLADQAMLLVWSAARKPLVDVEAAFNYAESASINLYLVVVYPHSARWLAKTLSAIDGDRVILVRRQLSVERIMERVK